MWLILSLLNAVTSAGQNAYYKKISLHVSPLILLWFILGVTSILFSPLFFFGIPHIGNLFLMAVIIRLFIDTLANYLYIKGISLSPLSLTIPMLSLTPIFILIFSAFINHLFPPILGLLGIFTTVVGIYYLNFDHDTKHLLSPFLSIYKEKGVRYVVFTSILWGIVTSLMKLGIDNSSASFYTAFFQIVWFICLTPIVFLFNKKGVEILFTSKSIKKASVAGIFDGIQLFAQNVAYTLALPVYVNTVGNLSILFSSFFGWLFFKEKIHRHIVPTIIIVIGIILITIAQK